MRTAGFRGTWFSWNKYMETRAGGEQRNSRKVQRTRAGTKNKNPGYAMTKDATESPGWALDVTRTLVTTAYFAEGYMRRVKSVKVSQGGSWGEGIRFLFWEQEVKGNKTKCLLLHWVLIKRIYKITWGSPSSNLTWVPICFSWNKVKQGMARH